MSKFDNKKSYCGKSTRSDIGFIKFKVIVALFFFKKVTIEKEEWEITKTMERYLNKWCSSKGINFSIYKVDRPYYIKGHAAYLMHDTRHYKILCFSR